MPQTLRARTLLTALFLAALFTSRAGAQVGDGEGTDTVAPPRGVLTTLRRAPVVGEVMLLGEGAAHAATGPLRWDRDDLRLLGGAVGGLAVVSLLDEAGRDFMRAHKSEAGDRWERRVEPFGSVGSLKVLGAFFVAGLALDDPRMRGVAAEGLASSLVASVVITPLLTEVVGRPRPRADQPAHTFRPFSNNHSFPSGHTTQAFAVASVIATEYDHPLAQSLAYGLASAVGVSRMYRQSHFLSDVVGAALIGSTVGRAVARFGQRRRQRLRLTVGPAGASLLAEVTP